MSSELKKKFETMKEREKELLDFFDWFTKGLKNKIKIKKKIIKLYSSSTCNVTRTRVTNRVNKKNDELYRKVGQKPAKQFGQGSFFIFFCIFLCFFVCFCFFVLFWFGEAKYKKVIFTSFKL